MLVLDIWLLMLLEKKTALLYHFFMLYTTHDTYAGLIRLDGTNAGDVCHIC